ncbi:MAG: DUF5615 family PIN-like protein [Capsulimonadaceae bacterium]
MLTLLLDENISPSVAVAIARLEPAMPVQPFHAWESGAFLGCSDEAVLTRAAELSHTLVTFDLRTITPLVRTLSESGISHAGVILVDQRTIAQRDVGSLARALCRLWRSRGQEDWTDKVVFLLK